MSVPLHKRTSDVKVNEDILFSELHLSDPLLKGLNEAGFYRPSPIQLQAIPLGRFGVDIIAQAKAGTGKTCVFGVVALEAIKVGVDAPQASKLFFQVFLGEESEEGFLILTFAVIRHVMALSSGNSLGSRLLWNHCAIAFLLNPEVGKYLQHIRCSCFIGGTSVADDTQQLIGCHIVTGTPGRLKQLVDEGYLKMDAIRLLVLDEADQLLQTSFWEPLEQIFKLLPLRKQVMAFSATYPEDIVQKLLSFMQTPQRVMLSSDDLTLVGVKLYKKTVMVQDRASLYPNVASVLSAFTYHQCVIFSNNYQLNTEICRRLQLDGYPVATISGSLTQQERNEVIRSLKSYEIRVLISTDLTARGVDIEHINLVINLDIPSDPETFIHRVGRTGRFGSYGAAVTFVTSTDDEHRVELISQSYSVTLEELPDKIPEDIFVLQVNQSPHVQHNLDIQQQQPQPIRLTSQEQTQQQPRFQTEVGAPPAILETPVTAPQAQSQQPKPKILQERARQPHLQQLQYQQQHNNREAQIEERGRLRQHYEHSEIPKNSPVLVYIKEKGWPDPRPLHRLMETEEWSHPKSVDIRKRVRGWKYDVCYAKVADKNTTTTSTTEVKTNKPGDADCPYHGYVSKVPPDVIKPLTEIASKKRAVSSGNYSAPTPNYTAFSQPHNLHSFHVAGSSPSGNRTTSTSIHNSSSMSISSSNKERKDNFFF